MTRVYFFGCWNALGHYWFTPQGHHIASTEERSIPFDGWIDSGWAPRRFKDGCFMMRRLVDDPMCCFIAEVISSNEDRLSISFDTEEYAQGLYLLHVRKGWTLMSWWDRKQGDRRAACNSNFVMEGEHADEAMLAALREHFPHVVVNLERAGVELKQARP